MSAPIELRQRFRLWKRDDALKGLTPQKLATGPAVNGSQAFDLFVLVGLQYRIQRKAFLNGAKTYEWSEWIDCRLSLEGYDEEDPPQKSHPIADAVASAN